MNLSSFFHAITVIFHVVKPISIIIAPFILLTSVVAGFDTSTLRAAGEVIEHYRHHVEEHGQTDLTLIDFLVSHFSTSAQPDDEHDGLPLLGGIHAGSSVVIPIIGTRLLSFVAPLCDILPEPLPVRSATPTFTQVIFQPPRA